MRRASLSKRLARRCSRGEAGTAVSGEGGGGVGVRRPTGFVISKIMQDVWQLVRILTVLSFAHLPPWQVVICAVQTFHWLPPTPPTLRGGSEATRQGTPKLLALAFTQRDSSPGSGMWSSLESQQSVSEDEQAASLSCSRRAATHTAARRRFSSADHTHAPNQRGRAETAHTCA